MAPSKQSGSVNEEIYNFQLIEFIASGGSKSRKKRSLDIVPSGWMSFDNKEGKLVTKFCILSSKMKE